MREYNFSFTLKLPERGVPRWLAAIVLLATVLAGGSYATVKNPPFQSSEKLSANKLNEDLDDLDKRLTTIEGGRLVATINGKSYSVGATTFSKKTSTGGPNGNNGTYDGAQISGYGGAKTICENATGVQSAHMCTLEEVIRSRQAGIVVPDGWMAGSMATWGSVSNLVRDCVGWSTNNSSDMGLIFDGTAPYVAYCNLAHEILCCD